MLPTLGVAFGCVSKIYNPSIGYFTAEVVFFSEFFYPYCPYA
jgi:hypothetical protein